MKTVLHGVKEFIVSLFRYPVMGAGDGGYDTYWTARRLTKERINEFQRDRIDLTLRYIDSGSSVMDIGCGNGMLLAQVHEQKKMAKIIGVDVSADALAFAQKNGLETIRANVSKRDERRGLPDADYILLFEVIEHVADSEELLRWAYAKANKGICISVPNTGFIGHRLRLLFGRFPLQWRVHPSEHVRFWTVRDMHWWLHQLGYAERAQVHLYRGVPWLSYLWPSLFFRGIFIYIEATGVRV